VRHRHSRNNQQEKYAVSNLSILLLDPIQGSKDVLIRLQKSPVTGKRNPQNYWVLGLFSSSGIL
jgi:hypothetical protein